MFVFPETDNCGKQFFTYLICLTFWVHRLFWCSVWLCFAVDREEPRMSDVALLTSAWIRTNTVIVLLSAETSSPFVSALATWTAGRGNAKVLKVKKPDWKEKIKRSILRKLTEGLLGILKVQNLPLPNLLFSAKGPGLGVVSGRLTHLENTFALISQDKWHYSKLFLFFNGIIKQFCSFMEANVWKRWAMGLDQKPLLY